MGGQEQRGAQRAQVAPGRLAAREDAALDRQAVVAADLNTRMPDTGSLRDRDHDLDPLLAGRVEAQQFAHQRERDAGRRRLIQARELQLHVGAVVGLLEDEVLLLEVEQRARGDRDDELAFQWRRAWGLLWC